MPLEDFPQVTEHEVFDVFRDITDRSEQITQLEVLAETEPAFAGMKPEDIGVFMNQKLGELYPSDPRHGTDGAGYARFKSSSRWLDAAGYNMNKSYNDIFGVPGVGSFGEISGGAFKGLAGLAGVTDDKDLQQWESTGHGLPGSLATVALGGLGPVGMTAMGAMSYGAAVDDAKSRGASGGRAFAAGAIDTAVNVLTLKMGAPIAKRTTNMLLARSGAAKALMDTSELTGRELLKEAVKTGAISKTAEKLVYVGSEALTEAAQTSFGVIGDVSRELIVDPDAALDMFSDPAYWSSMLVAEAGMAAFGSTIGRVRDGRALAAERSRESNDIVNTGDVEPADPSVVKAEALPEDAASLLTGDEQTKAPKTLGNKLDRDATFEYKTESGSEYRQFDTGFSQRFVPMDRKMPNKQKAGYQPTTASTLFVDEAGQKLISETPIKGERRVSLNKDKGEVDIYVRKQGSDTEWVLHETLKGIKISREPGVGLHPFEGVKLDGDRWTSYRLGSKIVEVNSPTAAVFKETAEAEAAGTPASDLQVAETNESEQKAVAQVVVADSEKAKTGTVENPAPVSSVMPESSATLELAGRLETQTTATTQESSVPKANALLQEGEAKVTKVIAQTAPKRFTDISLPDNVDIRGFDTRELQIKIDDNIYPLVIENQKFSTTREAASDLHGTIIADTLIKLDNLVEQRFQTLNGPAGEASFRGNYTPEFQLSMKGFLESSGIQAALQSLDAHITFREVGETNTVIGKLFSEDRVTTVQSVNKDGSIDYIITHDKGQLKTIHELGHVVDYLLQNKAFGDAATLEWQTLKQQFAGDAGELSLDLGHRVNKVTGEVATRAQLAEARRGPNEWAAEAFSAYMLDTKSKFRTFMQKNFKALDDLFIKVVNAFKAVNKNYVFKKELGSNRNQLLGEQYTPGYHETKAFFDKLFNPKDNAKVEEQLRRKVNNYKLGKGAANALAEVLAKSKHSGTITAIDAIVNEWAKNPKRTESNLISQLSLINLVNQTSLTGADIKRIQSEGFGPSDVMSFPNMNRLWKSTGLGILGVDNIQKLPKGAQDIISQLGSSADLDSYRKQVIELVGKVLSDKIPMDVKGDQVGLGLQIAQAFAFDRVVGKWLRGELPGQDGIPMKDARTYQDLEKVMLQKAYSEDGMIEAVQENYASFIARENAIVAKQFPLLVKELKKIRGGGGIGKAVTTSVLADGTYGFAEANTGKKKVALIFHNEQEALNYAQARNDSGKDHGITFDVKKAADGKQYLKRFTQTKAELEKLRGTPEGDSQIASFDGVWKVVARQDPFKTIAMDYDSHTRDLVETQYHEASMPNEPGAVDMLMDIHQELRERGFDVGPIDSVKFTGEFLRKVFTKLQKGARAGKANLESFARLADQISDFRDTINNDPVQRAWYGQLAKELDVPQLDPVELYVRMLEESGKYKGKLRELQNYAGQGWVDFAANMSDFAYNVMMTEFDIDQRRIAEGKVPKFDMKSFESLSEIAYMRPAQSITVMNWMGAMQTSQPDGVMRNIANGVKFAANPMNTLKGLANVLETLHHGTFGNPIHIAESNPLFRPFKEGIVNEGGLTNLHGTLAIEEMHLAGELVQLGDGDYEFRKVPNSPIDDKAYLHVHANPDLHALADTIRRASQTTQMTLTRMLEYEKTDIMGAESDAQFEGSETVKQAMKDYSKGKSEAKVGEDMTMLREFIYRSYAATLSANKARVNMTRRIHTKDVAKLLFKGSMLDILPERAEAVSDELSKLVPGISDDTNSPKRQELVKEVTGWEDSRVKKFDELWVNVHHQITKMGMLFNQSRWYVSEKRFRRFLVPYAVTEGKDKGRTGARDFDTAKEANVFLKAKHEGIKVTAKTVTDQQQKKGAYRGYSNRVEEAISHVVSSRAELMSIMLNDLVQSDRISIEEAKRLKSNITSLQEEIQQEASAGRTMTDAMTRRYFKPGREHLDMTFQTEQYIWSSAIEMSRQLTDSTFSLYASDPRVQAESKKLRRFENTLQMLRTPDSEGQRLASKAAFSMFMAGNVSTALIEIMQFPISLSHILVENGGGVFDSFRIPAEVSKRAFVAAKDRIMKGSDDSVWSGHERVLIREAERQGRLNVRNYIDLNDDNINARVQYSQQMSDPGGNGVFPVAKKSINAAYTAMNKFYGFFNRINAEISLVGAYETLKRQKHGNGNISEVQARDLFARAMDIADAANGSHGRAGRPRWMTSNDSTMRTVGQLAWSLQAYSSSYVANWLRLINKSLNGNAKGFSQGEVSQSRKALAVMTGIQVGAFGAMGIPLVGSLAKIVQTVLGEDVETEMKDWLNEEFDSDENHAFSDAILFGMQRAAGIKVDLRSRFAVQGIGPMNQYEGFNLNEFGGPLLNMAGSAINGWRAVSTGDVEPGRALINFLPIGFQRATRQLFYDEGQMFNKGGKFIMQPTKGELVGMALGFSPTRYIDHVKSEMVKRFANEQDAAERSRVANEIALMITDGDPTARLKLEREAERLNKKPKELADSVATKVMNRLYGTRTPEGSGPYAQRAARLYPSLLPNVPEVKTKGTRLETLAKLGQLPKNWQKTMNAAMLQDQLQLENPGLSKLELKNYMSDAKSQGFLPFGLSGSPRAASQEGGFFGLGSFR